MFSRFLKNAFESVSKAKLIDIVCFLLRSTAAERRRGSWGLLSVFEDCLRFLLQPPPQQQQRGGGATLGHTPSDQQGQTPECDPGRCRLEWNQDDGAPVGGASVMTLLVSIYSENCQINQFASS